MRVVSIVLLLLACALVSAVTFAQTDPDTPSGVVFSVGATPIEVNRDSPLHFAEVIRSGYIEGSWNTPPEDVEVRVFIIHGDGRDNEWYISVADHGEVLREHGCTISRSYVKIPFRCILSLRQWGYFYGLGSTYALLQDRYWVRHNGTRQTWFFIRRFNTYDFTPGRYFRLRVGFLRDGVEVGLSPEHTVRVLENSAPTNTPRPTATDDYSHIPVWPTPTPRPTATRTPTPTPIPRFIPDLFAQYPKLVGIWQWDNYSKQWIEWKRGGTSDYLREGEAYFMKVTGWTIIGEHRLSCNYLAHSSDGPACLNMVVW